MAPRKRKSAVKSSAMKKQKKKPASAPTVKISSRTSRAIKASSSSSSTSRKSIATSSIIKPDEKSPNRATALAKTTAYSKGVQSRSRILSKACASEPVASTTAETRAEPASKALTRRSIRKTVTNGTSTATKQFATEASVPSKSLLTKARIKAKTSSTRSAVKQAASTTAKTLIESVSRVSIRRSTRLAIAKGAVAEQPITDTSASSKNLIDPVSKVSTRSTARKAIAKSAAAGNTSASSKSLLCKEEKISLFTEQKIQSVLDDGGRKKLNKLYKIFTGVITRSKTSSEAKAATQKLGSSPLTRSKPIQKSKESKLDLNSNQKINKRLSTSKLTGKRKLTQSKGKRKTPKSSNKLAKMQSILDDNGRKSLDKLINNLFPGVNTRSKTSPEAKTSTQKSGSSPLNRSKPIRKSKKSKLDSNSNQKITKWLSKSKLIEETKLTQSKQKRKTPKSPNKLDITVTKKTKGKLPRSNSFEKYGILMPSVEEMLEQHKKYEEHKKTVAAFDEIEDVDLEPSFLQENEKEEEPQIEILDCKHLTIEKLSEAFDDNLTYITEIFEGTRYSERHRRFHNYKVKYNNTTKDLTYNTSMIVFTDDQKLHLMSLMEKALDPENKHTKYFFQVLLPELCLKIFMDVHNMSKKQAASYLDKRPIV